MELTKEQIDEIVKETMASWHKTRSIGFSEALQGVLTRRFAPPPPPPKTWGEKWAEENVRERDGKVDMRAGGVWWLLEVEAAHGNLEAFRLQVAGKFDAARRDAFEQAANAITSDCYGPRVAQSVAETIRKLAEGGAK